MKLVHGVTILTAVLAGMGFGFIVGAILRDQSRSVVASDGANSPSRLELKSIPASDASPKSESKTETEETALNRRSLEEVHQFVGKLLEQTDRDCELYRVGLEVWLALDVYCQLVSPIDDKERDQLFWKWLLRLAQLNTSPPVLTERPENQTDSLFNRYSDIIVRLNSKMAAEQVSNLEERLRMYGDTIDQISMAELIEALTQTAPASDAEQALIQHMFGRNAEDASKLQSVRVFTLEASDDGQ